MGYCKYMVRSSLASQYDYVLTVRFGTVRYGTFTYGTVSLLYYHANNIFREAILGQSESITRFSLHYPQFWAPPPTFFGFLLNTRKSTFWGSIRGLKKPRITHLTTHILCRFAAIDTTLIFKQLIVALMIYKGNRHRVKLEASDHMKCNKDELQSWFVGCNGLLTLVALTPTSKALGPWG